jgi:hypothetical protein
MHHRQHARACAHWVEARRVEAAALRAAAAASRAAAAALRAADPKTQEKKLARRLA